ncbi:MAG: FG-GAP-like repeat-containing protein, partial [bacterium]|nr:FG-GAP-like repeat-containing protein [bacterium]
MEIFLGLANGNVACVSATGQVRYNKHLAENAITGIVGFITEHDAGLVAVSGGGDLIRTDSDAELVWKKTLIPSRLNPPVLGDVNRDSDFEIIVSSTDGWLFIVDQAGNKLNNFREVYLNCRLSAPVLADVNRNGNLDVILVGEGKIFAFHYTGAPVTNFPIQFERAANDARYPAPVIADLDADGFPEIFVATASGKVLAFDINGSKNELFPLSISGASSAALGLHDLNGDGNFDLYARSDDGYLYSWQLGYTFDQSQLLWGEYLKDATNNGVYHQQVELPVRQGMLLPEKAVYNYPNPTEGNSTVIRYYLRDAARVTIRIYDMAGELVQELEGSGFEAMDNEV